MTTSVPSDTKAASVAGENPGLRIGTEIGRAHV